MHTKLKELMIAAFLTVCFMLGFTLASAIKANALESEIIGVYGNWILKVEMYNSGRMTCSLQSESQAGEILDLTLTQDGKMEIWVFTQVEYTLSSTITVDVVLEFDETIWTLEDAQLKNGTGGMPYFLFTMSQEKLGEFMKDFRTSSEVFMLSMNESGVTRWSLNGSAAAAAAQAECGRMLP